MGFGVSGVRRRRDLEDLQEGLVAPRRERVEGEREGVSQQGRDGEETWTARE